MEKVAGVYSLAGIVFASELPLPELTPLNTKAALPSSIVSIRLAKVALPLSGTTEIDPDCWATSSQYLLRIPGVARYRVSQGNEIVIDPEEGALPLDVRAYLLGTVFVVLCHQRGLLPLHASGVRGRKGVAAFLGRSGEGKSSLAAHLARRGFPVVADDICLVDTHADGPATVTPAAPWLKLWRASLDHLGRPREGLEQVFSEDDKYRLPIESAAEPAPIDRLVFLERSQDCRGPHSGVEIEEVARLQAVPMLMNLTHQAYLLEATGQRDENFLRCGRVLSHARAYRLIRPWGFQHIEPTVDAIDRFLRQE
jgi:hypothetical protein